MKQYGLLVFYRKTLQHEAFYSVPNDIHDNIADCIVEADDLQREREQGASGKPEAILEYDSETGDFTAALRRRDLCKLLANMSDSRMQQRHNQMNDEERNAEDRETYHEAKRQVEKDYMS